MMTIVLSGILIAFTSALMLKSHRLGLIAFIVLSMVAPHCHVAGLIVPFEILAFPIVGALLLFRIDTTKLKWLHYAMLAYFVAFTLSTYLSVLRFGPDVEWIRYASLLRYIVLLVAIDALLDRSAIRVALGWVLGVNLVFAAVQMLVPSSVTFFADMYAKESNMVLATYAGWGAIPRATGSFGSPVDLAVLCLVSASAFYVAFMGGGRSRYSALALAVAVIVGLMSLTKLFILGLPLMFVVCTLAGIAVGRRSPFKTSTVKLLTRVTAVTVIVVVGVFVVQELDDRGFRIAVYLEYLTKPLDAFATRYDRDEGVLGETIAVVRDNLVFGVGSTRVRNEFVGDSTYVSLMHDVGVVGAAVIAIVVLGMTVTTVRRRDDVGFVVFAALMITGLALPTLFSLEGAVFLAYAFGSRDSTQPQLSTFPEHLAQSVVTLRHA